MIEEENEYAHTNKQENFDKMFYKILCDLCITSNQLSLKQLDIVFF